MAELTKTDNRQPIGKIKPTDKMVMMPSLFDGTKPAMSKLHYERFNLYINFQTKSGHLTDPVGEAIDLFKHTLDKTALVWFQMNRSKFKDLTTLKMMFLQRYNPWGKTKREQLQSWNILSFDPKNTDIDEHIDLINTLGDMVDQKKEAKKEKFIETMPMMIQTHLIICKDWAEVKDKAKSLEYIIQKCDPPTPTMPLMETGATVPGLYSHIAHSVDKEEGEIPQLLKGTKFLTKVEQFTDVFSLRDEIGTCPFIEVHLKLKDETLFFVRQYPMREEQKKVIQKEMDKLKQLGIIHKGLTGYSSPVVLVKWKNQNLYRVSSDFHILNEKLVKINHAFPLVRDCIEQLGRKKCHYLSIAALHCTMDHPHTITYAWVWV